jgi:hypothetical protein
LDLAIYYSIADFLKDSMILKCERGKRMRQGRVIIDFESDDEGNCSWNISQKGTDTLDNENLISLFEHIIGELMPSEY